MIYVRIAVVAVASVVLSGCISYQPNDYLKVSGPCAPNFVSVGLHF
jgi:hypothetical protein